MSDAQDNEYVQELMKQISIAGARPNQISYLLDGTDISDQGGQSPGSAAGAMNGLP